MSKMSWALTDEQFESIKNLLIKMETKQIADTLGRGNLEIAFFKMIGSSENVEESIKHIKSYYRIKD